MLNLHTDKKDKHFKPILKYKKEKGKKRALLIFWFQNLEVCLFLVFASKLSQDLMKEELKEDEHFFFKIISSLLSSYILQTLFLSHCRKITKNGLPSTTSCIHPQSSDLFKSMCSLKQTPQLEKQYECTRTRCFFQLVMS